MRIFSFINILLLLVVMVTHEGAHLDGLLSPAQSKWLHAGAKVMLSGQIDGDTVAMIAKNAREHVKAEMPINFMPAAEPFDFAAESTGGGNAAAIVVPANYSAPAAGTPDLDQAFSTVLASLQNS